VPPTRWAAVVQVTTTVVTSASTAPEPPETVQSWVGPVGCRAIVTE
jgi:hypothetical protein